MVELSGTRFLRFGVLVLVVALVLGVVGIALSLTGERHATAYFSKTVGLYKGSDVRVLGVPVGKIDKITPAGSVVRVEFSYDSQYKIPADAKALVVAPAIVSDRYLQLAPVYQHGPVLKNGATIPRSRTAVPVELGDIYRSLDDLSTALGPQGANKNGSLSRLLKVGANNLAGNGADIHQTIVEASKALATLNGGSDDLFGTVRNLSTFTTALKKNDAAVVAFNKDLAGVSQQLDGEKTELAAALKNLGIALGKVNAFVKDNKAKLSKNVDGLVTVTNVLTRERKALAQFLTDAPDALSNLQIAYNQNYGTLDNRNNFRQFNDPTMWLCSLLISLHVPQSQCDLIRQAVNGVIKKLPKGDTLGLDSHQKTADQPVNRVDPTLAGILGKKP